MRVIEVGLIVVLVASVGYLILWATINWPWDL